ncbi:MAG: thiol peroxidase [Armatimonadaceae bacterium]
MEERNDVVTFKGSPMTLVGPGLEVGSKVPETTLVGVDLAPVSPLEHSAGKPKIFITVPSVDTSVCSLESKKFSDALQEMGDRAAGYVISADLPFALKRWCAAEGVDNLTMLSDYRGMEMAKSWGLYLKELGLFARAVYVTDADGKIVYEEIVPEIGSEPDYKAALTALQQAGS